MEEKDFIQKYNPNLKCYSFNQKDCTSEVTEYYFSDGGTIPLCTHHAEVEYAMMSVQYYNEIYHPKCQRNLEKYYRTCEFLRSLNKEKNFKPGDIVYTEYNFRALNPPCEIIPDKEVIFITSKEHDENNTFCQVQLSNYDLVYVRLDWLFKDQEQFKVWQKFRDEMKEE